MASEVSTSDPSHGVKFLGPETHNYEKEDTTFRCTTRGNGAEHGIVLVGTSTVVQHKIRWNGTILPKILADVSLKFIPKQ